MHAGAKNPLLGDEEDGKESEPRPVSYSYTFFHLIFALASMYSAMLLTGWTSAASERSELMDVGWTTVWVRICRVGHRRVVHLDPHRPTALPRP